ncbi:Hypothetical protein PHPALM_12726 [Phytophthora palmivora]|uniref:Uncharacterized protein n=1 Tax=Phytophthora palmivora TaxID=4796 RepID=A0A2P4XYZ8_9STRA|nr:Hypothetical protein PHPALM_12726 [Phytophthora palmivora]
MSHLELYNHRNLQNASKNRLVTTRSARRLGRGGRAPKYPELEERLHVWVLHRNSKGLRAKDNYLRLQAQIITAIYMVLQHLHLMQQLGGWRGLRRGSSSSHVGRQLYEHYWNICSDIPVVYPARPPTRRSSQHQPHNVINMDQVPRYFETEPKRQQSQHEDHARYYYKNKPKIPDGAVIHVNKMEIWSDEILMDLFYLVDSYGCHVKRLESHRPERYNTFVTIIPLNLVNILQPLDVAMTHSSQAFYQNNNGEYIGVMQDPAIQITKFPATTQWVNGLWVSTRTPENVNKAFEICSLVPKEPFNEDKLHQPLKEILAPDLDIERWHAPYHHLLQQTDDQEQLCVAAHEWDLPDDTDYVASLNDLERLINPAYLTDIMHGDLFSASTLYTWSIGVKFVDADCKVVSTFV